ncbi:MAG: MarR family transcriptional regulator [Betaproteobacteria bacterium]|nr:MarR family transcriptional regulator [Betaproteobacteria bacterium]
MIDLKREAALRDAIELLYFGYRAFTDRPDRILASRGLGRVHHRVLYFVARNPDISIQDLLVILDVTKQALNGPLRQLIEMKLVATRLAPSDRRVRQLRLTYEGEKLEGRLTGTQMQQLGCVFDAAGAPAEAAWRDVMRAIASRR